MPRVRRELAIREVGQLVQIAFGRQLLDLQHRDAARIAQWIRIHARRCAALNHDPKRRLAIELDEQGEWHGTTELWELGNESAQAPLAQQTGVVVDHHSDLVVMRFGSLGYGMHYNDATIFSEALRAIAESVRKARGSARAPLAAGLVTDAEDDYRRGVA